MPDPHQPRLEPPGVSTRLGPMVACSAMDGAAPGERDVVVGLGSNLGDRWAQLRAAVRGLAELGHLVSVSTVFETEPVGGPPQGPFLNAAARLRTEVELERLLEGLLGLERAAGRVRRERWGPRTLDLDVLWAAGVHHVAPQLTVPHPRLCERAFALIPLVEVAPDACDPTDGLGYLERARALPVSGLRRASGSAPWCPPFPTEIMTFRAV